MFYDWILQKSNDSAINTGDRVYFILFSLKPNDKGKYTYGYEYAKRQNDNDSPKYSYQLVREEQYLGILLSIIKCSKTGLWN